jgi:hypothetical protein
MATEEEKARAMEEMKNKIKPFVFLGLAILMVIFIIVSILTPNESDDSKCEIYYNSYQTPLEVLIEKVKENDENCSKYVVFTEGMDKYGEKWVERGYYILTDNEWSEMRKYQDIQFYLRANSETPKFHTSTE